MKKVIILLIALNTIAFAQWNGQTNKQVREQDMFGPLFDQALDSSDGGGGGTNLEPEFVVTPAESKIVMDVDSTRINGDLRILGDILCYGSGQISSNVAIGRNALGNSNTNIWNVAIGYNTLYNNTTGYENTAIGASSMYNNTTGYYNVGIGYTALMSNTIGIGNIGIGESTLKLLTTGSSNTAIGVGAGYHFTINGANTGIGTHSMHYNKRGSYNTAIGENSFYNLVSGNYNIRIGNTPWVSPIDSLFLTDAIYIGRNVIPSNDTTINEIVIGNGVTGAGNNTITLGNSSIAATHLFGNVNIGNYTLPSVDGSAGTVMKTDGNGNLYWGSDIYGGGGGSGSDTASVLYHLSRYVTADSFATYAEGIARYEPKGVVISDIPYLQDSLTTKAPKASPTFTGTVVLPSTTSIGAVSSTELGYLDNTTSAIQTQINSKQATLVSGSNIRTINSNTLLGSTNITVQATIPNIADTSKYVETTETSAWDKNGSNDLLTTDTTAVTGKIQTKYQSRNYITDGNTNWNNTYGFITGTPITYPDSTTIAFGGDAILLDPTTLEIDAGELTVIGGAVEGDTINYTAAELDSILSNAKMKWDTTTSTGYATQYDLTQIQAVTDTTHIYTVLDSLGSRIAYLEGLVASVFDAVAGCCDLSDNTPPAKPTSLVATPSTGANHILTWTDPTAFDLDSIRIYRGSSNDTTALTTLVAKVNPGVETYTWTGGSENTTYWWGLKAVDDSSNISNWSNTDSSRFAAAADTGFYKFDAEDGLANLALDNATYITDTSGFAHTGTHSYKFRGNGTTPAVFADIYPFPSGYGTEATIWVSYYVYIPSSTTTNVTSGDYQYLTLFGDAADVNGDAGWLGISTDGSDNIDNWVKPWGTELATGFATNTWLKVEHKYVQGTGANGQDSIWVNGTPIYGSSTATGTVTTSRFRFGYPSGSSWRPLSGEAIYFDDIILKRTRVQE